MNLTSRVSCTLGSTGEVYVILFELYDLLTGTVLFTHEYEISATLDKAIQPTLIEGYYKDFCRRIYERLIAPDPSPNPAVTR